jgi:lactoylglutathione lyase
MLTSVYSITVHVRDQAAAVKYYTEKLGFEVKNDNPMPGDHRWIEVAPPGAHTRILLYKATPDQPGADSYEAALAKIGTNTGLILDVDDIEATFITLRERGATIVEEPHKQYYGWWGVIADQDDNTYGVHS